MMKLLIPVMGITPGCHGGVENFIYAIIRGFDRFCPDVKLFVEVSPGSKKAIQSVLSDVKHVIFLEDKPTAVFIECLERAWYLPMFVKNGLSVGIRYCFNALRRKRFHRANQMLVDVVFCPCENLPVLYYRSKPVVMMFHDFRWFERSGSRLTPEMLRQAPLSACITAWPDPFLRMIRLMQGKTDNCFMIPFVMDTPKEFSFQEITVPRSFLYASSNGHEKNHEILIRALGVLKRRGYPQVMVFCVGPLVKERMPDLELLIRNEGVGEWIHFLGWVPREVVCWFYRHVAGVVSTTQYEAMSGTVLEGWQYGKPVACSRIPSIEEMVNRLEVQVRFFDNTDAEDVANALVDVLERPEPYRMGSVRAAQKLSGVTPEYTVGQIRDVLLWSCGQAKKPTWHPYKEWWR